jgi:G3E family GTPase
MPTPIYIISGFLGAGKTTLINSLLESAPDDARIMVLVNEFGSISIDREIIKADPINIVDLSGGCICCGMFTELMASLWFALDDLKADVILIESTGLALPQEIARQALSPTFEGRVELGGVITVVDVGSLLTADYPIIEQQLKEANVVVLNKIDLIDSSTLARVRDRIKLITTLEYTLFETSFGRLSYNEIFSRRYESPHITYTKTRPGEFDSTAGFATVCLVRNSPVDLIKLLEFYQRHRETIIRSKGFVLTEKGGVELQFSNSGMEVKEIDKPLQRTELILIVKENDKEFIESEFRKVFDQASA